VRVSEKTLELNVGAEIIQIIREGGYPTAYLCGLTQLEESRLGADSLVELPDGTRLMAFQFKRPHKAGQPHRFQLVRRQHELLWALDGMKPGSVMYMLPFIDVIETLHAALPVLTDNTGSVLVRDLPTDRVFEAYETRIIQYDPDTDYVAVNPRFRAAPLVSAIRAALDKDHLLRPEQIANWQARIARQPASLRWARRHIRFAVLLDHNEQHASNGGSDDTKVDEEVIAILKDQGLLR